MTFSCSFSRVMLEPVAVFTQVALLSGNDQASPLYCGHHIAPEIISHCVCLYFSFILSYCDVEEMIAEGGVQLTNETVRFRSRKFALAYARKSAKCFIDTFVATLRPIVFSSSIRSTESSPCTSEGLIPSIPNSFRPALLSSVL
jgi:hypothetical protein